MVQCLTFWPGYRRVRTHFEASLQRLDQGIGAKSASCSGVSAQELAEPRSVRLADKCAPVWDQVKQRAHGHEGLVLAGEVRSTTANPSASEKAAQPPDLAPRNVPLRASVAHPSRTSETAPAKGVPAIPHGN